mgnify:CR=1 FL=1
MIEDRATRSLWREGPKALAALTVTLALFFAIAFGFDASAVRVFLGLTPPLDVPYVGTRAAMVDTMLDMAQVGPSDHVIDLGTGDGRILLAAAQQRGASGLGVDLDPTLIDRANSVAANADLSDRVTFVEQDLFDTPLHDADVVTMFLLPSVNLRLRQRLLAELQPGSRIVSNRFDMGDWRPDDVQRVGGYQAYLWIVPADVEGVWRLDAGGTPIPIMLEQSFQDIAGTAVIDGAPQTFTATMRGENMRFTLNLPAGEQVFEGTVEGDLLTPVENVGWSAVREKAD